MKIYRISKLHVLRAHFKGTVVPRVFRIVTLFQQLRVARCALVYRKITKIDETLYFQSLSLSKTDSFERIFYRETFRNFLRLRRIEPTIRKFNRKFSNGQMFNTLNAKRSKLRFQKRCLLFLEHKCSKRIVDFKNSKARATKTQWISLQMLSKRIVCKRCIFRQSTSRFFALVNST